MKNKAHICFPPKINLCCTGGMPSFSSTLSFMRETCGQIHQPADLSPDTRRPERQSDSEARESYFVVGFNIQLDLLACQGADSGGC